MAVHNAENGYATIFGYYVKDPERFGIMEFDKNKNVISVEEKPKNPKSNYCITGLYFYPAGVSEMAEQVVPSARGELEITTLNDMYLKQEKAIFVQTVQNRQDMVISAPEEIAYHEKWIDKEKLLESADAYGKSPYGEHLRRVAEDRIIF